MGGILKKVIIVVVVLLIGYFGNQAYQKEQERKEKIALKIKNCGNENGCVKVAKVNYSYETKNHKELDREYYTVDEYRGEIFIDKHTDKGSFEYGGEKINDSFNVTVPAGGVVIKKYYDTVSKIKFHGLAKLFASTAHTKYLGSYLDGKPKVAIIK